MRQGQSKTFFLCVPKYIPILLHSVGCMICAIPFPPGRLEWPPPAFQTARCLPTAPQPDAKSLTSSQRWEILFLREGISCSLEEGILLLTERRSCFLERGDATQQSRQSGPQSERTSCSLEKEDHATQRGSHPASWKDILLLGQRRSCPQREDIVHSRGQDALLET